MRSTGASSRSRTGRAAGSRDLRRRERLHLRVGRGHPLRDEARSFFESSLAEGEALVTSAEVLQELLHAYLPVGRMATLDAAMQLAEGRTAAIWPIEPEDVRFACSLVSRHPELGARHLLHLACCRRRDVTRIRTFDRALAAATGARAAPDRGP